MLLPPLRERMELLHSLLPQGPDRWESLSKGQVRLYAVSEQTSNITHTKIERDKANHLPCVHGIILDGSSKS